jgi:hypothetical protein
MAVFQMHHHSRRQQQVLYLLEVPVVSVKAVLPQIEVPVRMLARVDRVWFRLRQTV